LVSAARCRRSIKSLIAVLMGAADKHGTVKVHDVSLHRLLTSPGVISGPPAAAFARRAITVALEFLVIPRSLMSRAVIALRISRMAVSKNCVTVSRGHSLTGFAQSISGISANSGRIVATAPASHGSGSRPLVRMASSVSMLSTVACSARVEIHPNRMAATSQPHSMSQAPDRRPGG
jgi:hypothetical protein